MPQKPVTVGKDSFYVYAHPIDWWDRFADVAEVRIYPWRSFTAYHQKVIFPDNELGKVMFDILYWLEDHLPNFFVRHFQYRMIVLAKK